jgi:hypothetical protein
MVIALPWSSWEMVKPKPMCERCGWQGQKRDLIREEIELKGPDEIFSGIHYLYGTTPSHCIEYHCPICQEKLASDLRFHKPFFDQETFAD